jgi:competence protein ComEC
MKNVFWILIISAVIFRVWSARPAYTEGDNIRITARITGEPVRYDYSQSIKLSGLYTQLPLFPELSYGDTVSIEGVVSGSELKDAKLVRIVNSDSTLGDLRKKMVSNFESFLPSPHGALLGGILLGSRKGFSQEFWADVRTAGLSHIIVASGTNISFVALCAYRILFLFFRRKTSMYFVILSIILYLGMAGFDPPLVRAGLMAGILIIGQLTGRVVHTWSVFMITALFMLFVTPNGCRTSDFSFRLLQQARLYFLKGKSETN